MENTNPTAGQNQQANFIQQTLPNSTAVLVLGILSIVTCWCCWSLGLAGLILGIIALVLAKKGKVLYNENPGQYTEGSLKNMNAGKICAIIGTAISSLYLLVIIFYVLIMGVALGTLFTTNPWENFL